MSPSVFPTTYIIYCVLVPSCSTEPILSLSFISLLFRLSRLATATVTPKLNQLIWIELAKLHGLPGNKPGKKPSTHLFQVVGGSKFVKHEAVDISLHLRLYPTPYGYGTQVDDGKWGRVSISRWSWEFF